MNLPLGMPANWPRSTSITQHQRSKDRRRSRTPSGLPTTYVGDPLRINELSPEHGRVDELLAGIDVVLAYKPAWLVTYRQWGGRVTTPSTDKGTSTGLQHLLASTGTEHASVGAAALVRALRSELIPQIRAEGFQRLRITGTRLSGARPGRTLDLTIELTEDPR